MFAMSRKLLWCWCWTKQLGGPIAHRKKKKKKKELMWRCMVALANENEERSSRIMTLDSIRTDFNFRKGKAVLKSKGPRKAGWLSRTTSWKHRSSSCHFARKQEGMARERKYSAEWGTPDWALLSIYVSWTILARLYRQSVFCISPKDNL